MNSTFDICIVIPFYNEQENFLYSKYEAFLANRPNVLLCLVDDGSTDDTRQILSKLHDTYAPNTHILLLDKNVGKGEAVRAGMNYCVNHFDCHTLGYLDADLAVSLEEFYFIAKHVSDQKLFCFGSRILKVGSNIQRKWSRFVIGRVLATVISKILDLKVYDTQCGCKAFTKDVAAKLFEESFISNWLFDIELFFRFIHIYGLDACQVHMDEIPLKEWIDRGDSKVKPTYFFKLWWDLIKIRNKYKSGK